MRRLLPVALAALLAGCAQASYAAHFVQLPHLFGFRPRLGPDTTAAAGGSVAVAAGDIGFCGLAGDGATAALVEQVPGTVLTLGDNAYPDGTVADFERCFAPTWGRFRARMHPSPGNHEWHDGRGAGYSAWFGAGVGEPGALWYSFDVGAGDARWHLVSLNSNLRGAAMQAQAEWLAEDLRAHPARCTLAYWHHALFVSSRDSTPEVRPLWAALDRAGADVILAAHWHVYERFDPMTADGVADSARGIRSFVVGTGGAGLDRFARWSALPGHHRLHSRARDARHYGVLRLELYAGHYRWAFVGVDGRVRDAGDGGCH